MANLPPKYPKIGKGTGFGPLHSRIWRVRPLLNFSSGDGGRGRVPSVPPAFDAHAPDNQISPRDSRLVTVGTAWMARRRTGLFVLMLLVVCAVARPLPAVPVISHARWTFLRRSRYQPATPPSGEPPSREGGAPVTLTLFT